MSTRGAFFSNFASFFLSVNCRLFVWFHWNVSSCHFARRNSEPTAFYALSLSFSFFLSSNKLLALKAFLFFCHRTLTTWPDAVCRFHRLSSVCLQPGSPIWCWALSSSPARLLFCEESLVASHHGPDTQKPNLQPFLGENQSKNLTHHRQNLDT